MLIRSRGETTVRVRAQSYPRTDSITIVPVLLWYLSTALAKHTARGFQLFTLPRLT